MLVPPFGGGTWLWPDDGTICVAELLSSRINSGVDERSDDGGILA
jgi:hypothetical protein